MATSYAHWMGFCMGPLMYVKGGGGKFKPLSKTFKNDAKMLKLAQKLENLNNFPKFHQTMVDINIFWRCQHFFGRKKFKNDQILVKFQKTF